MNVLVIANNNKSQEKLISLIKKMSLQAEHLHGCNSLKEGKDYIKNNVNILLYTRTLDPAPL